MEGALSGQFEELTLWAEAGSRFTFLRRHDRSGGNGWSISNGRGSIIILNQPKQ